MIPFSASQIAALGAVARAWPSTPFALIGASALSHHIALSWRQTQDLDLTIAVDLEDLPASTAKLRVASAPAIAVLKMTAWLDRPADRERDFADLAHLFDEYLDGGVARWRCSFRRSDSRRSPRSNVRSQKSSGASSA